MDYFDCYNSNDFKIGYEQGKQQPQEDIYNMGLAKGEKAQSSIAYFRGYSETLVKNCKNTAVVELACKISKECGSSIIGVPYNKIKVIVIKCKNYKKKIEKLLSVSST